MTQKEKILKVKTELYRLLKDPKGYELNPHDMSIVCMLALDKEVQEEIKKGES